MSQYPVSRLDISEKLKGKEGNDRRKQQGLIADMPCFANEAHRDFIAHIPSHIVIKSSKKQMGMDARTPRPCFPDLFEKFKQNP